MSSARWRLNPSARTQYAGYVAWRGLVPEAKLSTETRALLAESRLFVIPGLSHVILYPVPGEPGLEGAGELRINAIWYRNVREGRALDDLFTDRTGVRRPNSLKAGTLQQKHVDAFVTAINDVEPSRMVFRRQVLVGDAAAATRPHVSASTARALRAAFGLANALLRADDYGAVADNLAAWEREHVALARDFTERGRMIGRRLQVEGSFVPGDPELTQITMPVGR